MEILRLVPFVLLLCSYLVLTLAADPVPKTEEFLCVKEGLFPDPENCHKYYHCTSSLQAIHETCWLGWHFDLHLNMCFIGGCSILNKPSLFGQQVSNDTQSPPEQFKCSTIGQFPHPRDCRRYYTCDSNLKPHLHSCFMGLGFYDIDKNGCAFGYC